MRCAAWLVEVGACEKEIQVRAKTASHALSAEIISPSTGCSGTTRDRRVSSFQSPGPERDLELTRRSPHTKGASRRQVDQE
jgi:hypothetical protein